MLQTVMQLSTLSLTTSYSTSFHPFIDFSIKICGESESDLEARFLISSSLLAKPEPRPPKEYADLEITGYPIFAAAFNASSTVSTATDSAIGIFISFNASAKSSLSSEVIKVLIGVPRTLTPYFLKTPFLSSWIPTFKPV